MQYVLDNYASVAEAVEDLRQEPPPGAPNVAETLWRTVADHRNRRYFYESTRSPNVFWVDLADLDFSPAAPVRKLKLADGSVYAGNAAAKLEKAEPFKFLPAAVK